MPDTYATTQVASMADPAIGATVINYSGGDQTVTGNSRGLLISTAGTLKVTMARGDVVSLVLAVGVYPVRVVLIWQTGSSTAAGHLLF